MRLQNWYQMFWKFNFHSTSVTSSYFEVFVGYQLFWKFWVMLRVKQALQVTLYLNSLHALKPKTSQKYEISRRPLFSWNIEKNTLSQFYVPYSLIYLKNTKFRDGRHFLEMPINVSHQQNWTSENISEIRILKVATIFLKRR